MFVLLLALRLACFLSLPRDRARKLWKKRTRNSRNVPAPNARRARAAREQGLHATHHARNLDARVALATLAWLCLVVLCSGSSRRCLCFSPRVFRRLRCLWLSLLTRFPFLDSQVSVFCCFLQTLDFEKMQHLTYENLVFRGPGGPKMDPKWLPKCFKNKAPVRGASGRASGSDLGGFLEPQEAPQRLPRTGQERQEGENEQQKAPNDP